MHRQLAQFPDLVLLLLVCLLLYNGYYVLFAHVETKSVAAPSDTPAALLASE